MIEVAGVELLPSFPVFLAFALAGLALNIVPGADMTFVIASAAGGAMASSLHSASALELWSTSWRRYWACRQS